jgi:hypothetical protein
MTYNFDPDQWYDNEWSALKADLVSKALTPAEFNRAVEELNRRYDAMLKRLDGTYQLP